MQDRPGWFKAHLSNIADNIAANILWYVLGSVGALVGALLRNWDFAGLQAIWGTTAAIVTYLLAGIGIGELAAAAIIVVKMRATVHKGASTTAQDRAAGVHHFPTQAFHADFLIKDADAEVVAKSLLDDLSEVVRAHEEGTTTFQTHGGVYYAPDGVEQLHHVITANGLKVVAVHGYRTQGAARMTADPSFQEVPEMFVLRIIQGGTNTTQVKFDTDHRDIFRPFATMILDLLKEKFTVVKVAGLDVATASEVPLGSKSAEVKWGQATITPFVFPPESPFGLGLALRNRSSSQMNGVSAKLNYLINTETKETPVFTHDRALLPWVTGSHTREHNPQKIETGDERSLVLVCWNSAKQEIWLPTSSLEAAKQTAYLVVQDSMKIHRIRVKSLGTMLVGKSFYFEVEFSAEGTDPFVYKGQIAIGEDGVASFSTPRRIENQLREKTRLRRSSRIQKKN